MPNLNAIDAIGDTAKRELNELLSDVVDKAIDDIDAGDAIEIQALYLEGSRATILKGLQKATVVGLGKTYVIPSIEKVNKFYLSGGITGKDISLSRKLYDDSRKAETLVKNTVDQHIKTRTNWKSLTVDLNKKVVPKPELPKYIKDVEKAFKAHDTRKLEIALRKAKRQVDKFTNEAGVTRSNLKKAYGDIIKTVEKGDKAGLELKITNALKKQSINSSEATARTELSRRYFEAEIREMQDDDDVVGYKIELSPSHPRYDECNFYTEVDMFGMGAGVYPKTHGIPIPVHVRCICMITAVLRSEVSKIGRKSDERIYDHLKAMKDNGEIDNLKALVGAKGVNRLTDWQDNLKGWEGVQEFTPIPSGLVEKN
jgi:hypothetical protein